MQASDALSRLQSAKWQALHPLLSLLGHASDKQVSSEHAAEVIAQAVIEVETVPAAAGVPLMKSVGYALLLVCSSRLLLSTALQHCMASAAHTCLDETASNPCLRLL